MKIKELEQIISSATIADIYISDTAKDAVDGKYFAKFSIGDLSELQTFDLDVMYIWPSKKDHLEIMTVRIREEK